MAMNGRHGTTNRRKLKCGDDLISTTSKGGSEAINRPIANGSMIVDMRCLEADGTIHVFYFYPIGSGANDI